MRRRRVLVWVLALLLVAAAAAAHVRYWYGARARMAVYDPDTLPARLLASEELPFAAWLPYPHQNLAALARATEEDRSYLEALARLAELPPPRLPAFGPFPVPPSSEIALAADETGERFAVYARVYPSMALFARLAGALAKNPWLRGGQVYLEEQPVRVSWRGNVWIVTSERFPEPAPGRPAAEPALAWLRLGRPAGPAAAGRYRLAIEDGALELASETPPPGNLALEGPELAGSELFLLLLSGPRAARPGARAMAFFAAESGGSRDLPRAASLASADARPYRLPGAEVLQLGGRSPRRARWQDWRIDAIDRSCLQGATELAPRLPRLLAADSPAPLAWGLWLDLEGGATEVARIAEILEEIPRPLIGREELQRWRDAKRVLAPLRRSFSRITVTVATDPRALRLRFSPREFDLEAPNR